MRRSGFKRPQIERRPVPAYTLARVCRAAQVDDKAHAQPKADLVRSEAYRRLVAARPCIRCGVHGYSQAAHPNTGKGAGIKTDDRLCFPLCSDRPGVQGCHPLFDQGGLYPKEVRRAVELEWSAATQADILAAGQWPRWLPLP